MILDADIDTSNPAAPIVKLSGRMTLGTRLREVEARIDEVVDGGAPKLILDLSGVAYADSAGLGLIMILYGRMKSVGGRLRIVGPNESLQNPLQPHLRRFHSGHRSGPRSRDCTT